MSLFKRIFSNIGSARSSNESTTTVNPMRGNLRRKFARGIQYNLKIVIRGDTNIGKTALFQRLQGEKFSDAYEPTSEIQVASINWNYEQSHDVVKVDIWDIVDKGKPKARPDELKMFHHTGNQADGTFNCLDSEFLEVYKDANAVILMFDMTKAWSLQYVVKELPFIPEGIAILILANHRDMGHHRSISEDEVRNEMEIFLEKHPERRKLLRYAESSMQNGFGLKYIYKFFDLAYLQCQRKMLLNQLERNKCGWSTAEQDLDDLEKNQELSYDNFMQKLRESRQKDFSQSASAIKSTPSEAPPARQIAELDHRLHTDNTTVNSFRESKTAECDVTAKDVTELVSPGSTTDNFLDFLPIESESFAKKEPSTSRSVSDTDMGMNDRPTIAASADEVSSDECLTSRDLPSGLVGSDRSRHDAEADDHLLVSSVSSADGQPVADEKNSSAWSISDLHQKEEEAVEYPGTGKQDKSGGLKLRVESMEDKTTLKAVCTDGTSKKGVKSNRRKKQQRMELNAKKMHSSGETKPSSTATTAQTAQVPAAADDVPRKIKNKKKRKEAHVERDELEDFLNSI